MYENVTSLRNDLFRIYSWIRRFCCNLSIRCVRLFEFNLLFEQIFSIGIAETNVNGEPILSTRSNTQSHKLIVNDDYLNVLYSHKAMEIATRKGRMKSILNKERRTEGRSN